MKLQRLTINNIASIEHAAIDFGAAPLADERLFLITGETGSGKSTIIDCLCLALYGGTPRLNVRTKVSYDSNPDKEHIISHISSTFGLKPFSANSKFDHPELPMEQRVQPPVENWLRAFHDARFVITDSFHACVFSILFQKPFIVYGNKSRGLTRFHSLLSTFGLESRLVTDSTQATQAINEPIVWERVYTIKHEWQEKSMQFLKDNLQHP